MYDHYPWSKDHVMYWIQLCANVIVSVACRRRKNDVGTCDFDWRQCSDRLFCSICKKSAEVAFGGMTVRHMV